VPAVFGWLRLDRRGQWLLVDRGQAGFDESLHGGGSPITSPPIVDFIGRNYAHDAQGRWFWQNGPQRVFVDLDRAPYVWRVLGDSARGTPQSLVSHTGHAAGALQDLRLSEDGDLMVDTALGPGLLHDLDLAQLDLEPAGEDGPVLAHLRWNGELLPVRAFDPAQAGFVRRPREEASATG
jgi:hypothetical protein